MSKTRLSDLPAIYNLDTQAISELEKDIKSYDRLLKRKPNDANIYYTKAKKLTELGDHTADKNYYSQALESYAKAISLSPQAHYYTNRAELHFKMDRYQLAAEDIAKAAEAPSSSNKVLSIYTSNIIEMVQKKISKAIETQGLPRELESKFSNIIGVITDISSTIYQDNKFNTQDTLAVEQVQELEIVRKELSVMQNQCPALLNIIDSLQIQVQTLERKVAKHEGAIENISIRLQKICTKEEFDNLAKKMDKVEQTYSLFGGKLRLLEGKQQNQEIKLIGIDEALQKSNCYDKQKIKEDFQNLKANEPYLYAYANNFYWALGNYLLAYRAISTETVQGVRDKSRLEKIWEQVSPVIVSLSGSVPVAGGVISLIEEGVIFLHDSYKDFKFELKVARINELITNFILEEDLNLAVAAAAIKIANLKKDQITKQYSKPIATAKPTMLERTKDNIDKKLEEFNQKIDELVSNFTGITSITETPAGKMAIKDIIIFINHLATSKNITFVTQNTAGALDKEITKVFASQIIDTREATRKIIETTAINNQANQTKSQENCIIALAIDFKYDNPLLNHMVLMRNSIDHFGINKSLFLSSKLSENFILEVIASSDPILLLAGMMSVDLS